MRPLMLTRTRCAIVAEVLREPTHGLAISHRTGLSVSAVYTALQALEQAGLVAGEWEEPIPVDRPRRRTYQVTREGRCELATWRAAAPPARAAWLTVAPPATGILGPAL